ncbi:SseB family protein [Streptomyces sp. 7N604]|uniref:SseB family protein n=1 Tax=Streptomyces sp. 7N604 TaxID=3457415 RepID=UPI003FD318D6
MFVRVKERANIAMFRNPGSEVGPDPEITSVSGCSVSVELTSRDRPVVLTGVRAEVTACRDVEFDGTQVTRSSQPDLILSDDLLAAARQDPGEYRPLDPPHFEALLDEQSPVVRPALGSPQPTPEFPLTLHPRCFGAFYVAPVTEDRRRVEWNLVIDFTLDGIHDTLSVPLSVTGATGLVAARPDGSDCPTPVQDFAPDHWYPERPRHAVAQSRMWIEGHGSSTAVRAELQPGDLARYEELRRARDLYDIVAELLGLTVYLPLMPAEDVAVATERKDRMFLLAFTSLARLRDFADEVGAERMIAERFDRLIEDWAYGETGLILDPFTELELTLPPKRFPPMIEHRTSLISKQGEARVKTLQQPLRQPSPPAQPPTEIGGIRFARVVDSAPQSGYERQSDAAVRDRLLSYLRQGVVLQMALPLTEDLLDPAQGAVVPMNIRTDGRWIWHDDVAYYLEKYELALQPVLQRHIIDQQCMFPEVSDPAVQLAAHALYLWQRATPRREELYSDGWLAV